MMLNPQAQRQLAAQNAMLAANLAAQVAEAFVGDTDLAQQPVNVPPTFNMCARQQQQGLLIEMSDAERDTIRARQIAAQNAALREARTNAAPFAAAA